MPAVLHGLGQLSPAVDDELPLRTPEPPRPQQPLMDWGRTRPEQRFLNILWCFGKFDSALRRAASLGQNPPGCRLDRARAKFDAARYVEDTFAGG